jgi:hypothetical protein
MEHTRETFQHEPVDHTILSPRILQILPELTSDGIIQCRIVHTTIDSDYACLSYVWGPASPSLKIVVNDKLFGVRQNLYWFLDSF